MADKVIEIDQTQLARFAKTLEETQSVLGRDAYEAVVYASVFVARSAAAYSKPSKKRREISSNPQYRKGGARFIIQKLNQPRPGVPRRQFLLTNDRNDPRRVIRKSGLMRNVWRSLQGLAASAKNRASMDTRDSQRMARLIVRTGADETAVNMTNYLQYFEDAYGAGATSIILGKAADQLNFRINEKLGVTVDRANRP
jgi:hypothetical protein